MMEPNPDRPARKVGIADHIWEAFESMAAAMGSDRDALINQAMFMFARLNGFLDGAGRNSSQGTGKVVTHRGSAPVLAPVKRDDGLSGSSRIRAETRSDEDPARREVAERVLETAAELERLIKGKGDSRADEDDSSSVRREHSVEEAEPSAESASAESPQEEEGRSLYLMAEGGEMDKVSKDRFVIGRGKHCDFVINSGKVSREHAVILRDGADYFIEDLGSSNGTWHSKQRIKRRKIEDGDEYYICSEKIKLVRR